MRTKDNNANVKKQSDLSEKVLEIRRVSKKTKGGNTIGFTALAVVGNKNGKVGAGYSKASDVSTAISKALAIAKRDMVDIKIKDTTIAHEVKAKFGAAEVMLKPAAKGTGIIAGGSTRIVVSMAGIQDISAKMLGSNNKIANVRCTIKALKNLRG